MTNHAKFQQHLRESQSCVDLAAEWLRRTGYNVIVNPMSVAATHGEWREHRNGGDLSVAMRVEVKGLSCDFTGPDDWPFKSNGEKAAIVCARHAWDDAKPKPYAFIQFNKQRTHCAFIRGSTNSLWWVEVKTDRRYDEYHQAFYMCPLTHVGFATLRREAVAHA